ncbi:MAG: hypothetical protein DYG85_08455 [Chloroflexi bacterium CFX1]|nr:hypothetical protein [Chloroflexi bacterium CFX1]MCK6566765.1 hypothetical protein [Anaerolineales bacterium]MCQ3952885.1 hypothetical protein [Chloroflexota bacterium]MDL1918261.1 hypothetical protein [Chloroflexi bacterium CFX5]NUQ58097.1 hypothetical protein [Anaerolineales bacterium]
MKRTFLQFFLGIFLSSCSLGFIAPEPTQPPSATPTNTATPPPTPTPVLPTLTFTFTPTLIGFKTATFTPEFSATPEATQTAFVTVTLTASDTPQPPVKMEGFYYVTISLTEIYKAKGCEPSVVRITAQAANPADVAHVLLFARFKSLKAPRLGKWTKLDMISVGAGTHIYDLSSDHIREDAYFDAAWIEYQIVSTTQTGREIGRTDIFKERLKMLACDPNATPVDVTPTATPTP